MFRKHCHLAPLYGEIPRPVRWAWQWLPDRPLWEATARTAGEHAEDEIARLVTCSNGRSVGLEWSKGTGSRGLCLHLFCLKLVSSV